MYLLVDRILLYILMCFYSLYKFASVMFIYWLNVNNYIMYVILYDRLVRYLNIF